MAANEFTTKASARRRHALRVGNSWLPAAPKPEWRRQAQLEVQHARRAATRRPSSAPSARRVAARRASTAAVARSGWPRSDDARLSCTAALRWPDPEPRPASGFARAETAAPAASGAANSVAPAAPLPDGRPISLRLKTLLEHALDDGERKERERLVAAHRARAETHAEGPGAEEHRRRIAAATAEGSIALTNTLYAMDVEKGVEQSPFMTQEQSKFQRVGKPLGLAAVKAKLKRAAAAARERAAAAALDPGVGDRVKMRLATAARRAQAKVALAITSPHGAAELPPYHPPVSSSAALKTGSIIYAYDDIKRRQTRAPPTVTGTHYHERLAFYKDVHEARHAGAAAAGSAFMLAMKARAKDEVLAEAAARASAGREGVAMAKFAAIMRGKVARLFQSWAAHSAKMIRVRAFLLRMMGQLAARTFAAWAEYMAKMRRARALLSRMMLGVARKTLTAWSQYVKRVSKARSMASNHWSGATRTVMREWRRVTAQHIKARKLGATQFASARRSIFLRWLKFARTSGRVKRMFGSRMANALRANFLAWRKIATNAIRARRMLGKVMRGQSALMFAAWRDGTTRGIRERVLDAAVDPAAQLPRDFFDWDALRKLPYNDYGKAQPGEHTFHLARDHDLEPRYRARREELYHDAPYKLAWDGAIGRYVGGRRLGQIAAPLQTVIATRLCCDPGEAICALAEAEGEVSLAIERLENEAYRREMTLACEIARAARKFELLVPFSLENVTTLDRPLFGLMCGDSDNEVSEQDLGDAANAAQRRHPKMHRTHSGAPKPPAPNVKLTIPAG